MKLRSLVALPLGSAIAVGVSSFWVSPAHAFFLRSTGRSTNSNERLLLNLDPFFGFDELVELAPGNYHGINADITYADSITLEDSEFVITYEGPISLDVISPISPRLGKFDGPPGADPIAGDFVLPDEGFINEQEYVIEFNGVVQEIPSGGMIPVGLAGFTFQDASSFPVDIGSSVAVKFTFGIGAERSTGDPDRGIIDLFYNDDEASDYSRGFELDVEAVPEPTTAFGLAAMSILGAFRTLKRQREKNDG